MNQKIMDALSADELEKILLQKRLLEYAVRNHSEGFPLNVEDLFEDNLEDMGFDKLHNIMFSFSDTYIRETATRIFADVLAHK